MENNYIRDEMRQKTFKFGLENIIVTPTTFKRKKLKLLFRKFKQYIAVINCLGHQYLFLLTYLLHYSYHYEQLFPNYN